MCLDEEQILLLIGGTLSGAARVEVEEHLEGCEACRRLVAVALRTADGDDEPGAISLRRGASVGRYLVLALLGRGGMGQVFSAYDPELDRRVALKLLPTARSARGARERLVREARALGKLSHPNVVQVYDVGEHEGDVFVAMELVDGQTLDAWCLNPPRPTWQEVLAAYLDAARGLSAAHAGGLVHRDVKPSNILRGNDGRVRVADFGLAAGHAEEADPRGAVAGSGPAADPELDPAAVSGTDTLPLGDTAPAPLRKVGLDEPLTATGVLLGTPLYMAPEQHAGSQVSPASDQYSLCAALYGGLYGVRPFTLGSDEGPQKLGSLLALKQAGVPAAPPAGSPVPAWIYHALARGLAPDPQDRHPSLDALIVALGADPGARRRSLWRRAAVGAAAAVALAAGVAGWVGSGAFADPCRHPERQLAGVWDVAVEARVRAAFLGNDLPYAEGTAARVFAVLDRYGADWSAMRGEVCRSSRSGAQHGDILALRDLCLDRRRGQLQAVTHLFADRPDPQILDRAVKVASDLYPIGYCADTEALAARVRPPEAPALRAQVAALQPRVDQLQALYQAGKYQDGLRLGEPLLAEVGAIPYPALQAQLQYEVGLLRDGTGDYEGAKALVRQAAVSAAEGRDEVLAARAWVVLLRVVGGHQQHFDEATAIRALGPMVMAAAHDTRTRGEWLDAEGLLLRLMGRYADAKVSLERGLALYQEAGAPDLVVAAAVGDLGDVMDLLGDHRGALSLAARAVALQESILGPDHPDVARALGIQALALYHLGDFSTAWPLYLKALAVQEKALGPDHPQVGITLNNLGALLYNTGDFPGALDFFQKALAVREKTLGPDHPDVGMQLNNLGSMFYTLGDYPRALATHERARAVLLKALGPDHPDVAVATNNVGEVLCALGDYPRALAMSERALAIREKALGPDHAAVADALVSLGRTRIHLGQLDAALAVLERGLRIKEKAKGPTHPGLGEPLLGLAELHLARHAPEQAVPLLERALAVHAEDIVGDVQITLAEALWQIGKDRPRARALAGQARATYERLGHRPGIDHATRWLADHPEKG